MLDLVLLGKMLDEALENETTESLNEFMEKQSKK
jgi:hypothetical protein